MNEHLFKLKKDSKMVGLMKILDGEVYVQKPKGKYWDFQYVSSRSCPEANIMIKFDTAHPFITKDMHGKDVFAGDRIRRINGEPCFVEWFTGECRYVLHNNENYYDIDILELEQGFELIEEKANA